VKTVRTIDELRAQLRGEVGLVPTMGALHDGHVSLFRAARVENELVVASLFVNAAQFGEQADLAALSARRGGRRETGGTGRCRRPLRALGRRDLSAGLRHVGRRRVERR